MYTALYAMQEGLPLLNLAIASDCVSALIQETKV